MNKGNSKDGRRRRSVHGRREGGEREGGRGVRKRRKIHPLPTPPKTI